MQRGVGNPAKRLRRKLVGFPRRERTRPRRNLHSSADVHCERKAAMSGSRMSGLRTPPTTARVGASRVHARRAHGLREHHESRRGGLCVLRFAISAAGPAPSGACRVPHDAAAAPGATLQTVCARVENAATPEMTYVQNRRRNAAFHCISSNCVNTVTRSAHGPAHASATREAAVSSR